MSTKRRIAFVSPRFSDGATVGGAETLLKNLALRLVKHGFAVDFLTTCATNHVSWENEREPGVRSVDGLTVHFFEVDENRDLEIFLRIQEAISRGRTVPREDQETWLANSVNSSALNAFLEEQAESYEAVLMGPYLFGLICAAARICPERTLMVPCLHDEPFAYLDAIREVFESVRGWVFNSEPERELAKRLYTLDAARSEVVGMGLDSFDSDPAAFRKKYGISEPYVIYSGRREPLKGTPLLLDYMTAFRARTGRDVRLVLTGSGPVFPDDELRPYLQDLGFVSETDKHNAMAGAVAFCHPSLNESFGIVLMESWLAGTPGLVREGSAVLRDQCRRSGGGVWFRTYPQFEEALCLLLDRADVRDTLGQQGKQFVQTEYSWETVERNLMNFLDRMAAGSGR